MHKPEIDFPDFDPPADLMVEDVNKVPLYTPRWGGPPVPSLVGRSHGSFGR